MTLNIKARIKCILTGGHTKLKERGFVFGDNGWYSWTGARCTRCKTRWRKWKKVPTGKTAFYIDEL